MATAPTRTVTEFSLVYDGPALRDGRMPVRDLAPALIALGDVFHQANITLNPDAAPIDLEFQAVTDGSVRVALDLASQNPDALQTAIGVLASDPVTALNNLISLVIGANGVMDLIRKIGHRQIQSITTEDDHSHIALTDGATFDVAPGTSLLYETAGIAGKTRLVVTPLRKAGVDGVRFNPPVGAPLSIDASELEAFDPRPETLTTLSDVVIEQAVTVITLIFGGRRWFVSDGGGAFWVTIEDRTFLDDVAQAIARFGTGDVLWCRMRIRQVQDDMGMIDTERRILQVIRHTPAGQPMRLPIADDYSADESSPSEN